MSKWMSVWNATREQQILTRVRYCGSFFCRLRGLTFRRRLPEDEGVLLVGGRESRMDASIHMFFVFFPIAVVWLDRERRVVDTVIARPFRPLYLPKAPAKDVLEGAPSLLKQVSVGDLLEFGGREVGT